jgi:hypothetical protein
MVARIASVDFVRADPKRDHVARLALSSSSSSNRITVAGATTPETKEAASRGGPE